MRKFSFLFLCIVIAFCFVCKADDPDDPCNILYWNTLRSAHEGEVSPGNPLADTETGPNYNGVPYPEYTPRPYNRFHIDGCLLMRYSEDSGEDEVYDELVFLRGAGEYYEFCWKRIRDNEAEGNKFENAMNVTGDSGFNMIRQFVYSGFSTQDGNWFYPFMISPIHPTKYGMCQ